MRHVSSRPSSVVGHQARMVALATVAALLFAGSAGWLGLAYLGRLSADTRVTAHLPTLGDSLGPGSDVKYRGLIVGRVQRLEHGRDRAAALLLRPDQAAHIPAGVTARVLPNTLFGAEYVDLVAPRHATTTGLTSGTVLAADTSRETVRLMDAFEATQRILVAVDPADLDAAVSGLARALDGRGAHLGGFLRRADTYVGALMAHRRAFYADLRLLARALDTVGDAEPHLVAALRSSETTARTIVADRQRIASLTGSTTLLADDTHRFLARNDDRIVHLVHASGPTVHTLGSRTDRIDAILAGLPAVLLNGAGGISHGRIQLQGLIQTDPMDPYTAADCPRYRGLAGPNCRGSARTSYGGSSGPVGSAEERALLASMFGFDASSRGLGSAYALLAGPVLRGQEVSR